MGPWWKGNTEMLVPSLGRSQNGWSFWNMQPAYCFCQGAVPPSLSPPQNNDHSPQTAQEFPQRLDDLPPCSTCRYTGMTVCAGLSLYFLKLANEETTTTAGQAMAKHASKTTKNHKPFFYGGALVWAAAGIYRSMLD